MSIKDEHARLVDEGQKMQAKNETLQVLFIVFKSGKISMIALYGGNARGFRHARAVVVFCQALLPVACRPMLSL